MKRVIERESWGFSMRPMEGWREREMEDEKSKRRRDDRMRKLTEGDGGS